MNSKRKKALIKKILCREAAAVGNVTDTIADLAEPGFQEHRSAGVLASYLAERGFKVEFPWSHIPTAFKASKGKGRPVISVLAEYDALPNCGAEEGQWGHGCGHNLLGGGAAAAAVAAAGVLQEIKSPGTVVMWGCPAEEIIAGKVYMARDGAFKGDDAIVGWHPSTENSVSTKGGSSLDSLLFEYFGKTAHGAGAHAGRSALDGVMLLDVAANYLREHVPENVRIHMCILNGGEAPNVVPAYAKVWYYVRGKDRKQVDEVRQRLIACAKGAAQATGTKMKVKRLTGVYSRLENDVMAAQIQANFRLFGTPRVTEADKRKVKRLIKKAGFNTGLSKKKNSQGRGSSDEDSVSWLAPFGRINVACVAKGTTGHHRDYSAQVKLPFAHRGMLKAAEIMAGCMVDLATNRKLLDKARAEFKKRTKKFKYDPLIPKRQKPPTVNP